MSTREARVRTRKIERGDRPVAGAPSSTRHSDRMLAYVIKAEPPESRQLVDPFASLYASGHAIEPDVDPERLLLLANESAVHSACLSAKTNDIVGRGWTLEPVRKATEGATPGDEFGPEDVAVDAEVGTAAEDAAEVLADKLEAITPDYTFDELLRQVTWERDAIGWGAWEIVRTTDEPTSPIGAIYPLPAHTLRATRDKDVYVQLLAGQTRYFRRFGADRQVSQMYGATDRPDQQLQGTAQYDRVEDRPATEVLVFKSYSPLSPWYPLPQWIAAVPAIAELTAIREFNVSFYESGGVVDRVIHVTAAEEKQAQDLADDITKQIEEADGGTHLSIITGGSAGSDVKAVFLTPTVGRRDGQMGGRRADLIEEVLMGHEVPPYRVAKAITGVLTGGGPSREMLHTYRTGVVEPGQTILESRLNESLFGPKGIDLQGYVWRLNDLDWDETELDLNIAKSIVEQGMGSPDDGREILGLSRTGRPEMQAYYYKGVEIGSPRGGKAPSAAASALDALRSRARQPATTAPTGLAPAEPVIPPTNGSTPPPEPVPVA